MTWCNCMYCNVVVAVVPDSDMLFNKSYCHNGCTDYHPITINTSKQMQAKNNSNNNKAFAVFKLYCPFVLSLIVHHTWAL